MQSVKALEALQCSTVEVSEIVSVLGKIWDIGLN